MLLPSTTLRNRILFSGLSKQSSALILLLLQKPPWSLLSSQLVFVLRLLITLFRSQLQSRVVGVYGRRLSTVHMYHMLVRVGSGGGSEAKRSENASWVFFFFSRTRKMHEVHFDRRLLEKEITKQRLFLD